MSGTTWKSPELRRALAYHGDGLLDLFLGITLLDAWTILRGGPGADGAVAILFPLLLAAKTSITVPRLRQTDPSPADVAPGSRTIIRATFAVVVAATLALVLLAAGGLLPTARGGPGHDPWEALALVGLGAVAAAGLQLGAQRFVVYAGLSLIGFVLTLHSREAVSAYLTPALALGMVAWGGVLLVRFLATSPRPA